MKPTAYRIDRLRRDLCNLSPDFTTHAVTDDVAADLHAILLDIHVTLLAHENQIERLQQLCNERNSSEPKASGPASPASPAA